ncbi:MAG TPA: ABC transporter permease [Bacteroidota bacterium]|nr:ABC transporter permease [Bacteroidota bacterium]
MTGRSAHSNYFLTAWTLCQRELVRFYRQRSRMIGVIGSPLIFWFLIGSGLSGSFRHPSTTGGMSYLEYFFPGTMVLIILFTSIFSTISIIEDRREGFLQSVIIAPVARGSIALGKILGGTFLALVQAVILLLLTPFIGITMDISSILISGAVLFLISFGLTGLGFLIAWKMESTQGFHAIMNLFLIPLWLLSGALFPASGAASWLGNVMAFNPLTYGIDALRYSFYMNSSGGAALEPTFVISLLATFAFAVATFLISALVVRYSKVY